MLELLDVAPIGPRNGSADTLCMDLEALRLVVVSANGSTSETPIETYLREHPDRANDIRTALRDRLTAWPVPDATARARFRARATPNSLAALVADITPDNRHEEIDWGSPVGKEAW